MSSYPSLEDFAKKMREASPTPEDIQNLSNSINNVIKAGVNISMTWEALAGNKRTGHYEPYGVKWVQWIGWAYGLALFKIWSYLGNKLDSSRFFDDGLGRDWDEPEYRPFTQKTRWVDDEG